MVRAADLWLFLILAVKTLVIAVVVFGLPGLGRQSRPRFQKRLRRSTPPKTYLHEPIQAAKLHECQRR